MQYVSYESMDKTIYIELHQMFAELCVVVLYTVHQSFILLFILGTAKRYSQKAFKLFLYIVER